MIARVMALPIHFDLLVVDDNSPDGTGDIVRALHVQYPHRLHLLSRQAKEGLGRAYLAGFKWALEKGYDLICEMDADFSHNPDDLPRLAEACEKYDSDVAIGSRYVTGVNVVNWPMGRVLLSWFASYYVRIVTGMNIRDTTAGFVCYRRKVLETIPLEKVRFMGYAFQIEMKFMAWKCGFNLSEVPIIFTDRSMGTSKMSKGIISEAFFGVIKIKMAGWFRKWPKAS